MAGLFGGLFGKAKKAGQNRKSRIERAVNKATGNSSKNKGKKNVKKTKSNKKKK